MAAALVKMRMPKTTTTAVDSFAALDAIFGAVRAYLAHTFSDRVFVVSFLSNVAIAALIVWVGDQIGVGSQLSTAVVVLGIRIFTKIGTHRTKDGVQSSDDHDRQIRLQTGR
jgi:small basic protein